MLLPDELFSCAWAYFRKAKGSDRMVGFHVVLAVMEMLYWAFAGTTHFCAVYFILYAAERVFQRKCMFPVRHAVCEQMKWEFTKDMWRAYDALSVQDKAKHPPAEFRDAVNDAAAAVHMVGDWGYHEIVTVCKRVLALFFVTSRLLPVGAMCLFSVAFYAVVFRGAEKTFRDAHETLRLRVRVKDRAVQWRAYLMMFGNTRPEDVDAAIDDRAGMLARKERMWNDMCAHIDYINIGNLAVLLWLDPGALSDPLAAVVLVSVFERTSQAIKWMLRFVHAYHRSQCKYADLKDLLRGARFSPLPPQSKMPSVLCVDAIHVREQPLHLTMDTPLTVRHGDRWLITGPSGHGKTTFIHALQGKVGKKNAWLATYAAEYTELHDQLHSFDFARMSIRELCSLREGEPFDECLARHCLQMCEAEEWGRGFAVDQPIEGRVSTGQKSRVVAALLVLYPFFRRGARVLVLDEIERGLDPELAYAVLGNILASPKTARSTVIVVSHLERVREKFQWDRELRVCAGTVAEVRQNMW